MVIVRSATREHRSRRLVIADIVHLLVCALAPCLSLPRWQGSARMRGPIFNIVSNSGKGPASKCPIFALDRSDYTLFIALTVRFSRWMRIMASLPIYSARPTAWPSRPAVVGSKLVGVLLTGSDRTPA